MKVHLLKSRVNGKYFLTLCGVNVTVSRVTGNLSAVQCPRCLKEIEREIEWRETIRKTLQERKP